MYVLLTFYTNVTAVYDSVWFQLICQWEQKYFFNPERSVTLWNLRKSDDDGEGAEKEEEGIWKRWLDLPLCTADDGSRCHAEVMYVLLALHR